MFLARNQILTNLEMKVATEKLMKNVLILWKMEKRLPNDHEELSAEEWQQSKSESNSKNCSPKISIDSIWPAIHARHSLIHWTKHAVIMQMIIITPKATLNAVM